MNAISGLGVLSVTELDAKLEPEVVGTGSQSVNVTVVTPEGEPVSAATVVAKDGTATLGSIAVDNTGPKGNATLAIDPGLGPNQREGPSG